MQLPVNFWHAKAHSTHRVASAQADTGLFEWCNATSVEWMNNRGVMWNVVSKFAGSLRSASVGRTELIELLLCIYTSSYTHLYTSVIVH